MKTRLAVALAITILLAPAIGCAENEIGWIEKFALAADREAVLDQLLPGSEDYYFFHALHYQNTGQAAKLSAILDQWAKRYPDSARRRIIENRAALLSYDADPQHTLWFLRDRLKLEFNDQQQARDQKPDLPTKLDPARINRAAFLREGLENKRDLSNLNDGELEILVREKVPLSPAQRRDLLGRLKRPDLPGLVDVVEADLKTKESRGFGEFEIHRALLPEQLDDLAGRMPALYGNQNFVFARIHKLAPGADADAEFDPAERRAWLDRVWAYAKNLSPSFNSLKAQVLLQRLELDRQHGVYDKARFQEYLKLPRRTPWVNLDFLHRAEVASQAVDLNANVMEALPGLTLIHSDEELVRDYLLHLLKDEPSWEPWAAWLRDTWLKPVFAEAKMVNGVGDPEKWASLLTPQAFQALKERVDVDFSPANPPFLAPGDDASLDLFVKNAPKLIVKIYEINTLSYFLANPRQLNTDLPLDGLVANREVTHDFSADEAGRNPFRRTLRTFKFPELKGQRGAWVIEFIGGGKSSRALVRKGQWSLLQRTSAAGDLITVLDEGRQPVKDAVVWLDGRKLTPDAKSRGHHHSVHAATGDEADHSRRCRRRVRDAGQLRAPCGGVSAGRADLRRARAIAGASRGDHRRARSAAAERCTGVAGPDRRSEADDPLHHARWRGDDHGGENREARPDEGLHTSDDGPGPARGAGSHIERTGGKNQRGRQERGSVGCAFRFAEWHRRNRANFGAAAQPVRGKLYRGVAGPEW